MEDKWKAIIVCYGMSCMTLLEGVALIVCRIDGTALSATVAGLAAIIAGTVGFKLGERKSES